MNIDGRKIAEDIGANLNQEIKRLNIWPRLSVIAIGTTPAGESFISTKRKFGEKFGFKVEVHFFGKGVDRELLGLEIRRIARNSDGLVIQLPLPSGFNKEKMLRLVPQDKDPDVLNPFSRDSFFNCKFSVSPPVASAVGEILKRSEVGIKGKRIAVVGAGFLVGVPVAGWFMCQGVLPKVFEEGDDLSDLVRADIIVSGVGSPHIIKPKMIREGAILIDAGTSGQSGEVKGDIDPSCQEKASLFTPVPGGVGPIAVAKLFENLLKLKKIK